MDYGKRANDEEKLENINSRKVLMEQGHSERKEGLLLYKSKDMSFETRGRRQG